MRKRFGMSGKALGWVEEYMRDRSQAVRVNSSRPVRLRPVHTAHHVLRQPLCDNGRRRPMLSCRPLLSVVVRCRPSSHGKSHA